MKKPSNSFIEYTFRGNYFCLIPGYNTAFVVISKTGATFLKKVAIYSKTGKWIQSSNETHTQVGFTESSEFFIPIHKISNYEKKHGKLLKFAVWRDPVERLISGYKYFCLEKTYRPYFHAVGLYDNPSFDWFMKFVKFEIAKNDPQKQDPHIRRQSDHYQLNDVDYIIHMNDLFSFLEARQIPFEREYSNRTNTHFKLKPKLYKWQIKYLYYDDYKLKVNWRNGQQP
ncbi:sulfotransferase family 2 domain-containing protein [Membranihabitans maritimus]|uniref:sulfotransferase family 2 domain-containing protein n=1 Tax=Membranihabitans maritimus TaxID=2904244 RepID=UPI001F47452E|nr:sulfotransferase family 2 domain-containing protein [Membranihabitans maritimus]